MADSERDESAAEGVTQLDFEQAMSDFQTMFPSMEPAVIEAVLRANHGAVDSTIDQLLSMNSDYEIERSRKESTSSSFTPPPTYNQAVSSTSDGSLIRPSPARNSNVLAPLFGQQRILGVPLCNSRGWRPMLLRPLPSDFLRVDRVRSPRHGELLPSGRLLLQRMEEKQQESAAAASGQQQQVLDDERLAMILQNAEFVEALRSDQDFMESLATEQANRKSPGNEPIAEVKPMDEEAAFREKLRQMGRIPRRKLTQLARTFFRGKKLNFPSMGGSSVKERPILCDQDEDWTSHPDQDEPQGAVQRSQKYP